MNTLLTMQCKPVSGAPMAAAEIQAHLKLVKSWALKDGAIEKRFSFKNFHETIGFVNALAWIANTEDHHPDLNVGYDRCVVRFNTHSVGGLSINDFICAAKADALMGTPG